MTAMGRSGGGWLRRGLLVLALAFAASPALAEAPLLPPDFFDSQPQIGSSNVAIAADQLTYDADADKVYAHGAVRIRYQGSIFSGDRLVFDRKAKTAHFIGDVVVLSDKGVIYHAQDLQLSQPMREALMREFTITTKDGALITAAYGDFKHNGDTVATDATYSPCGQCIDDQGRHIGWSIKSARMIYHNQTSMVDIAQPSIYLLGVPVISLPWLSIPDPTKRVAAFRMPSVEYGKGIGAGLTVPYFLPIGKDTDLLFSPTLLSRQGLLLQGEWDQRFTDGSTKVEALGIYQLNPSAFAGETGDRRWRGAIQTSGEFKPIADWKVGWNYTAFSDPEFFSDYHYRSPSDKDVVNEVYATQLTRNEYLDLRVQQFELIGDDAESRQHKQALAIPNIHYRNEIELPHDWGQFELSAEFLGVLRDSDDLVGPLNGVEYNFGYAEAKAHGTVEGDWQKRWVMPGGVEVTPFLGLRADAAYYDGTSDLKPNSIQLFNATPIAAVDARYPLVGKIGPVAQVLEPIAQLVYRASSVTNVGITNDNAQSLIFEDTNLFSYNRFGYGTDRQETGLRANVGGHYQLNFPNGAWLDLLGGESFHLAGANAFTSYDPTQVAEGSGLEDDASYVVLGAKGAAYNFTLGSKLQVDPNSPRVARAGLGGTYDLGVADLSLNYLYVAPNEDRGVLKDQQEVSAGVTVPLFDYWKVATHGSWDVANDSWLDAGGGVHYDDGYLSYGGDIEATGPTNIKPNDLRFTATLALKTTGLTN